MSSPCFKKLNLKRHFRLAGHGTRGSSQSHSPLKRGWGGFLFPLHHTLQSLDDHRHNPVQTTENLPVGKQTPEGKSARRPHTPKSVVALDVGTAPDTRRCAEDVGFSLIPRAPAQHIRMAIRAVFTTCPLPDVSTHITQPAHTVSLIQRANRPSTIPSTTICIATVSPYRIAAAHLRTVPPRPFPLPSIRRFGIPFVFCGQFSTHRSTEIPGTVPAHTVHWVIVAERPSPVTVLAVRTGPADCS